MKYGLMKLAAVILAATFILSISPSETFAQGGGGRLDQEISGTDDIISRAQSIMETCGNARGRELLKLALKFQDQAMSEMGQHPLMSYRYTRQARQRALEAIKACQQSDENENLVQRQLELTDDLISRLSESLATLNRPMAESIYNASRDQQRRAWEFYHNHQYRPALRLSRQAEKTLRRLAEFSGAGENVLGKLEQQLRQTEQIMERTGDLLLDCGNDEADKLFDQAQESLDRAQAAAIAGDLDKAENSLRQAQRLSNKVQDLCAGESSLERVLKQLQSEMEMASGPIRDSGNSRALRLFEEAGEYLSHARNACDKNDTEKCAANLKAAQLNLEKAKRLAGL